MVQSRRTLTLMVVRSGAKQAAVVSSFEENSMLMNPRSLNHLCLLPALLCWDSRPWPGGWVLCHWSWSWADRSADPEREVGTHVLWLTDSVVVLSFMVDKFSSFIFLVVYFWATCLVLGVALYNAYRLGLLGTSGWTWVSACKLCFSSLSQLPLCPAFFFF